MLNILTYFVGFYIGYKYAKRFVDNLFVSRREKQIKEYNEYLRLVQSYNGDKTWKDLYFELEEKGWVDYAEWRDLLNEQQKTTQIK